MGELDHQPDAGGKLISNWSPPLLILLPILFLFLLIHSFCRADTPAWLKRNSLIEVQWGGEWWQAKAIKCINKQVPASAPTRKTNGNTFEAELDPFLRCFDPAWISGSVRCSWCFERPPLDRPFARPVPAPLHLGIQPRGKSLRSSGHSTRGFIPRLHAPARHDCWLWWTPKAVLFCSHAPRWARKRVAWGNSPV